MRCKYCDKEISIDSFCNKTCEEKYNDYYKSTKKYSKLFIFSLLGSFIFYLLLLIIATPNISISCLLISMGVIIFTFPFPTPQTIQLIGVLKSIKTCRILAVIFLALGFIFLLILPK